MACGENTTWASRHRANPPLDYIHPLAYRTVSITIYIKAKLYDNMSIVATYRWFTQCVQARPSAGWMENEPSSQNGLLGLLVTWFTTIKTAPYSALRIRIAFAKLNMLRDRCEISFSSFKNRVLWTDQCILPPNYHLLHGVGLLLLNLVSPSAHCVLPRAVAIEIAAKYVNFSQYLSLGGAYNDIQLLFEIVSGFNVNPIQ